MVTVLFLFGLLSHFFGDFTQLSTKWMLSAKLTGTPLLPILAHAGVHGLLLSIVFSIFIPSLWFIWIWLVIADAMLHFAIDVAKGKLNVKFPTLLNNANIWHWWVFGIDQYLHVAIRFGTVQIVCLWL
jgi:hypothetical protein